MRWYDIDALEFRAWYGDDPPRNIADAITDHISEGEGVPSWLVERRGESDYHTETVAYQVCAKHDRIKEPVYGARGEDYECGSCWLEKREASA